MSTTSRRPLKTPRVVTRCPFCTKLHYVSASELAPINADRDAFLGMAALRATPNPLRKQSIKSGGVH
ncbi:MAG: hypothetical protein KF715_08485 [Candidatus Didemnitutus sp.]|nr:hypothetical protein [Candidatus Didemnitutus sp.]